MRKYLTCLYVIRFDGTTGSYPSNDPAPALLHGNIETGVRKLENGVLLGSEVGRWECAHLYDAKVPKGALPLYSYHHSTGTEKHPKAIVENMRMAGIDASLKYRAYIIPTASLQQEGHKPVTRFIGEADEAKKWLDDNDKVWKILVYQISNNSLIKTFLN